MANYSVWALGESQLTISGGGQLDGVTQGDGSHLVGLQITLNSKQFEEISVRDRGRADVDFDDNDGNQTLRGRQFFDGVRYNNNTRIEAEYIITLLDQNTGIQYQAVGVNINDSSPSFATVEGLAFIQEIPPANVALTVIGATEGPGDFGVPSLPNTDIAVPPCFTSGTLIETPNGPRPVQALVPGDLVLTVDRGAQPIRWIGRADVTTFRMAMSPNFRPIRIRTNAFGPGRPARDLLVSPQHRVLLEGWKAELLYGEVQVLVAAKFLIDEHMVLQAWDKTEISYLHLQFDQHELIFSEGLCTESFNPGPNCLGALPDDARAELEALFPDRDFSQTALNDAVRPLINHREARALGAVA